jgi:hypothetical protein
MKKMLWLGALALPLLAVSEQAASAWCNFKFSCGFNLEWSCANNSFCCGLWKCAPPPVPCCMPPVPPWFGPVAHPPGVFGYDLGYDAAAPTGIHPVQYDTPWYGGSGYQPVNYYAPPSYWYGQ